MSIAPGDLLIGDPDGVLVVPISEVAEFLKLAKAKHALEQQWEKEIMADIWDRKWVEEAIDKLV